MRSLLLLAFSFCFLLVKADVGPGNETLNLWNEVLQKHVNAAGDVNYSNLKNSAPFQEVLRGFAKEVPTNSWSSNEKKAYWINVYNAFTLELIIQNLPLKSITDLDKPWDKKFIVLQGESYSLNQIEHEILRKDFKDPRIHFAINCASISCPKLLNKAFYPENLNASLERLSKEFINDSSRNSISPNKIVISSIFDWFKEDFTQGQSLIAFLNTYSSVKIQQGAKVEYGEYNWNLNGK